MITAEIQISLISKRFFFIFSIKTVLCLLQELSPSAAVIHRLQTQMDEWWERSHGIMIMGVELHSKDKRDEMKWIESSLSYSDSTSQKSSPEIFRSTMSFVSPSVLLLWLVLRYYDALVCRSWIILAIPGNSIEGTSPIFNWTFLQTFPKWFPVFNLHIVWVCSLLSNECRDSHCHWHVPFN